MDPLAGLLIIAGLLAGIMLGWFLGSRGNADRAGLNERLRAAETALAGSEERAATAALLRTTLDGVRDERDEALRTIAADRAGLRERDAAWEAERKRVAEDQEAQLARFNELAAKVLTDAQATFLRRADERFNQAGEKSEQQLKALLQPVEVTLKRYEEGLQRVEKDRIDSYAGLREAVDQVRLGQGQVKEETARLVNALRSSPKARGRWGEQQLRNVLEMAGLSEHSDFQVEVSVDTEGGRLRPDVIVRLPGGRELIIDAKCSLNAYLDASEQTDDAERTRFLRSHAAAIRNHANQLGQKAYWSEFGRAADYVIMFIPGEHFLSAALEQDHELWAWALDRKVLLATPTNLVAIARTVAAVWRQEKLVEDARQVDALGKEMFERLSVAAGHLKRVGGGLNSAVENYNKFVASFEGRVLVSARRFKELNVDTGSRELETVSAVDAHAREPAIELLPMPEEHPEAAE